MTLNDLLKRICDEDKDKVILFTDGKGWSNVSVRITDTAIMIYQNFDMPFDD